MTLQSAWQKQEQFKGGEIAMPENGFDQHDAEETRKILWDIKGKHDDVHFQEINPDELTFSDLEIAHKFFEGKITQKELDVYFDKNFPKGSYEKYGKDHPRYNFAAWLRTKSVLHLTKTRRSISPQ